MTYSKNNNFSRKAICVCGRGKIELRFVHLSICSSCIKVPCNRPGAHTCFCSADSGRCTVLCVLESLTLASLESESKVWRFQIAPPIPPPPSHKLCMVPFEGLHTPHIVIVTLTDFLHLHQLVNGNKGKNED